MSILVAGRAVQGLGTGLLGVALYVVVGHCYPEPLQARMFGAFAAAWVLPALVGPAVAGLIVDQLNWCWVFLAVAVVTVPIGVPVLRRLSGSPASQRPPAGRIRLIWAMLVGLGAALLQLLGSLPGYLAGATAVLAVMLLLLAGPRLLPAGTFRARRGLPATVLLRGLSAGAFVATQVFLPLLLVRERGLAPAVAGLMLTAGSVAWAAASWVRGRAAGRAGTTSAAHRDARAGGGYPARFRGGGRWSADRALPAELVGGQRRHGTGRTDTVVIALRVVSVEEQGAAGSALQVGDALFAALAIAGAGLLFSRLVDRGPAAYLTGFGVAAVLAVAGALLAHRARPSDSGAASAAGDRHAGATAGSAS